MKLGMLQWICASRFCVKQCEHIVSIHEFVGLSTAWVKAVGPNGRAKLVLSSGRVLEGDLHREWSINSARKMLGRFADMKKGYKQLTARPGHANAFVVAAWDEYNNDVVFFLADTLSFGETGAVYGLNRVGVLVKHVLTRCASLVVSQYDDDFTQLETEALASSAEATK